MTDDEISTCHRAEELRLALAAIRDALAAHVFVVANEAELQRQVSAVLASLPRAVVAREVQSAVARGYFDITVQWSSLPQPLMIVLELKVRGSAASVERQVQRYARADDVDAVVVVTTSQRLQRDLLAPGRPVMLGGKAFRAFALRSF